MLIDGTRLPDIQHEWLHSQVHSFLTCYPAHTAWPVGFQTKNCSRCWQVTSPETLFTHDAGVHCQPGAGAVCGDHPVSFPLVLSTALYWNAR